MLINSSVRGYVVTVCFWEKSHNIHMELRRNMSDPVCLPSWKALLELLLRR